MIIISGIKNILGLREYIRRGRPPGVEHNNIETLIEDISDLIAQEKEFFVWEWHLALTAVAYLVVEYLGVIILVGVILEINMKRGVMRDLKGNPPKPVVYIKLKSINRLPRVYSRKQKICSRRFKMKLLSKERIRQIERENEYEYI